jgi:hypothetical protein
LRRSAAIILVLQQKTGNRPQAFVDISEVRLKAESVIYLLNSPPLDHEQKYPNSGFAHFNERNIATIIDTLTQGTDNFMPTNLHIMARVHLIANRLARIHISGIPGGIV